MLEPLTNKPLFAVSPHTLYLSGIESALPSVRVLSDREVQGTSSSEILLKVADEIPNGSRILVFKPAPKIEHLAKKHGWQLIGPTAEQNRRFENKLTVASEFLAANLPILPYLAKEASKVQWEEIVERFGDRVVVQYEHGHAGSSSFGVQSMHAWHACAADAGERIVKITPWKDGETWTVNACVTKHSTLVSRPFLQLQNMPETGALNPLTTCGNWHKPIDEDLAMNLMREAERFGAHLHREGYSGWFGLDVLVSEKGIEGWIECNPRLTASVGVFTELQVEAKQWPLILLHALEHLGEPYELDAHALQHQLAEGFSEYHLVYRATRATKTTDTVRSGIYDQDGKFVRAGGRFADLGASELLLRLRTPNRDIQAEDPFAILFSRGEIQSSTRKKFDELLKNALS